jgi:hypothetical protein
MRKSRFTDDQIIWLLKQVAAGAAVKEFGRKHVSDESLYKWRSRFGGALTANRTETGATSQQGVYELTPGTNKGVRAAHTYGMFTKRNSTN